MIRLNTFLTILLCLPLAMTGGCNSAGRAGGEQDGQGHSHNHEHSDKPASFRAAIDELRDSWLNISTAMESGEPDAAHDPLHDVGDVLESIPELAADTDLPEADWNHVKAEVNRLLDRFGDIDLAFHEKNGDRRSAYQTAKPSISEGIAVLEAKLQRLEEKSLPAGNAARAVHDDPDGDNSSHDGSNKSKQ